MSASPNTDTARLHMEVLEARQQACLRSDMDVDDVIVSVRRAKAPTLPPKLY